MPQIFRPGANGIAQLVLVGTVLALCLAVSGGALAVRSSFYTGTRHPVEQPIPFSHAHHVGDLGLDCRYCHSSVETSAIAGLPATEVCMTCHSELFTNAALLAPVRDSFAESRPIHWNRVNDLGDFVYFNHAIHIAKGVACVTCHGRVDAMRLTWRENPMQMSWCLGCHRDPGPNLAPSGAVFDPDWTPPADVEALHRVLPEERDIDPARMTDCYVCHR